MRNWTGLNQCAPVEISTILWKESERPFHELVVPPYQARRFEENKFVYNPLLAFGLITSSKVTIFSNFCLLPLHLHYLLGTGLSQTGKDHKQRYSSDAEFKTMNVVENAGKLFFLRFSFGNTD